MQGCCTEVAAVEIADQVQALQPLKTGQMACIMGHSITSVTRLQAEGTQLPGTMISSQVGIESTRTNGVKNPCAKTPKLRQRVHQRRSLLVIHAVLVTAVRQVPNAEGSQVAAAKQHTCLPMGHNYWP